jgi:hypothetical protein
MEEFTRVLAGSGNASAGEFIRRPALAIQNHYQRLKMNGERRDKTAWRRLKRE